jgi:hypothetical protein
LFEQTHIKLQIEGISLSCKTIFNQALHYAEPLQTLAVSELHWTGFANNLVIPESDVALALS